MAGPVWLSDTHTAAAASEWRAEGLNQCRVDYVDSREPLTASAIEREDGRYGMCLHHGCEVRIMGLFTQDTVRNNDALPYFWHLP